MKAKLYALIKKSGGISLGDISSRLGVSKVEALKILRPEVVLGFIEERNGKYFVKNFLMPVVTKPAMGVNWDYEAVLKGKESAAALPESSMVPNKDDPAPHQQGERGTCVGQSTSSVADYLHIILTGQKPTGKIQRNIHDGTGVRDILYDTSFSAQAIYEWSRKEGNVTCPAGSYCSAAIRAWNKKGMCLESQWWTSKVSTGVWDKPYPATTEECELEAAKHKLDGYAAINTLTALKQCLATTKVALGAINIYTNYMDQGQVMENGVLVYDGNLPEIRGEPAGSHALCFIGYDDATERLFFRHSWEGWTKFGSISYRYWEQAGGDFWAPLDKVDTLIGLALYKTVEISVQPQEAQSCAVLTINGVKRAESLPAKISFEKGQPSTILVTADGYIAQTRTIEKVDDNTAPVVFVLETGKAKTNNPFRMILDAVLALIRKYWK